MNTYEQDCQTQYKLCKEVTEKQYQECIDNPINTKEVCNTKKESSMSSCSNNKSIKDWMDECVETLKNITTEDVVSECQKNVGNTTLPVWGLVLLCIIFLIILISGCCWCSDNKDKFQNAIAFVY